MRRQAKVLTLTAALHVVGCGSDENGFSYVRLSYIDHPKIGLNRRTLRMAVVEDVSMKKKQVVA
ncbi:MAG: hypothetical protein U0931_25370 [Vulcanimicrobiota bacterium]